MMLWNVGSVYVILLLAFLVVGFGIGAFKLLETTGEALLIGNSPPKGKKGGESSIPSSLKLAAVAMAGIIVGYFALGLSTVNSSAGHDHAAHAGQSLQQSSVTTMQPESQGTWSDQTMNNQLHQLEMEMGELETNLGY